jgi:hypothetical protein
VTKRFLDEQYRNESDKIPEICQRGSNVDDIEVMFECALNYPIMNEEHYAYITSAEYTIQDGGPMFFLLMPVIDGTFLPQNPVTMLKTGNFKVCFSLLFLTHFIVFLFRNVLFYWVPIVTKVHILWFTLKVVKKHQVIACLM